MVGQHAPNVLGNTRATMAVTMRGYPERER
jgi:hypothetical protein